MKIYLNGSIVPEHEACVSVFDHGFLYGDGIYETMRAYEGTVFMQERHLERLRRSASLIALRIPPAAQIRDAVQETMRQNEISDAYIRVTVSRGKGPIGLDPGLCSEPTFVVIAEPFKNYPEAMYRDGTVLVIAQIRRNSKSALDPRIKSLNFLNNILAKIEARHAGAYEALMLNPDGYLTEGTVSNIFFFRSGVLCTPSPEAGILDGITRELVIDLAREAGLPVSEGLFTAEDLLAADEVFFTNTTSEIMPVSRVGSASFPVGEATRELHARYRERVRKELGNRGAIQESS